MADWSVSRVEQLAPDAAAIKAAQSVAKAGNWKTFGRSDSVIWGECKGSGANPYQVRVDLEDAAAKCSCPSRKLPCKHSLGLLLMLAGGVSIPTGPLPAFVDEWIAGRVKRAEAKVARAAAPEKPPDPEAQARRTEKRESRVEAGIAQLQSWLSDIVTQGLASTRAQPPQFWSQMAARLVDAQAPGLARRVRALADAAVSGENWQSRLLTDLGRMQLLIDAYRRVDRLPPPLAAEVRTLIGWNQTQESVLERAGVRDRWQVLGHRQSSDDTLRTQHTWLWGAQSQRMALLLDFAVGNQPLPATLRIGQGADAEVAYYDGAPALRALIKEKFASVPVSPALPAPLDLASLQNRFAALLAENPFLERCPAVLGPVTSLVESDQIRFIDASGRRVGVARNFKHAWLLDSLAGGGALTVFGLWDGSVLDPVSVEHEGALFSLAHIGELPVLSKVA